MCVPRQRPGAFVCPDGPTPPWRAPAPFTLLMACTWKTGFLSWVSGWNSRSQPSPCLKACVGCRSAGLFQDPLHFSCWALLSCWGMRRSWAGSHQPFQPRFRLWTPRLRLAPRRPLWLPWRLVSERRKRVFLRESNSKGQGHWYATKAPTASRSCTHRPSKRFMNGRPLMWPWCRPACALSSFELRAGFLCLPRLPPSVRACAHASSPDRRCLTDGQQGVPCAETHASTDLQANTYR